MKKILGQVAPPVGMMTDANTQMNDTIQRTTDNDLYQGITRKLPYQQMAIPHRVQVTFTKTVYIIFPSAVRYIDLGSDRIIAGKADSMENVIRAETTAERSPGETNFPTICEDGSFYPFGARYAHELKMLDIEMKDLLENGDTTDFSRTRMSIRFRELTGEGPLLMKLIVQSIYKGDRWEIRHLGCKHFGVQSLLKSTHSHNGLFYFHTETRDRSNMAFRTDFIRFRTVDRKVPKRTAIQERVIDLVRSCNGVLVIERKGDVRTAYATPQSIIPDDKLLVIGLFERDDDRHQTIRAENVDLVATRQINELKIK